MPTNQISSMLRARNRKASFKSVHAEDKNLSQKTTKSAYLSPTPLHTNLT